MLVASLDGMAGVGEALDFDLDFDGDGFRTVTGSMAYAGAPSGLFMVAWGSASAWSCMQAASLAW